MDCIRLNKIDGFYKFCDGIRYLVILGHSWSDKICDSIKNICEKKLMKSVIKENKNNYYFIIV